ncbi:hypothetical protein VTL71DRAFT_13529 [Oculimacula yallundae]|uniref:Uncharacterized protein n=1 Tax=Oculimacula yallundae TaxID=86028 RepID=A0ABR4CKM1_9HELO
MLRFRLAVKSLSLWSLILPAVCARICGNETGTLGAITVWSQEDADIKLAGCTTLLDNLIIGHNFTGDFVLHGVQNLTRGVRTSDGTWWDDPEETGEGAPEFTSFTAPDLIEAGYYGISLNASSLKSVSFEKLQKAYSIKLVFQTTGGSMNFPALEFIIRGLVVNGIFGSMNFQSLTNVGSISLGSSQSSSFYQATRSKYGSNPPTEIDFPSLVNCSELTLTGNLSRVSIPKLEAIADFPWSDGYNNYHGGLSVYTYGSPFSLSLPLLWNASEVNLAGTFANFSFPALKKLDEFNLRSELPMDVDLSPLENVDRIYFIGNVTGYNITSLQSIKVLTMQSDLNLRCGRAKKKWIQLYPGEADKKYMSGFYCYEKQKKPFPGTKVGIGLGIGIPVILIVALVYWRGKRERKLNAAKDQLPDYETEMETRRTGGGEVLPEYVPSGDRRSTGGASTVSALSDMARPTETPRERPPGYEASHTQEAAHLLQRST